MLTDRRPLQPIRAPNRPPRTAWRVAARLLVRTGGDRLEQPKGFLVSDSAAGRVRFEGQHPDRFEARYDRITSLHYEDGAKHPDRLFNRDVEFYLTIRHSDDAGGQLVSTFRLNKADVASTLERLEADTGLTVHRTEARRSFLGLPIRVAVGDSVSITDVTGKKLKGRITALSESSLAVGWLRRRGASLRRGQRGEDPAALQGGTCRTGRLRRRSCRRRCAMRHGCAVYGCGAGDFARHGADCGRRGRLGLAGYSVASGAVRHPLSKSPEVYRGGGGAGGASAAVTVGPLLTRQRRGMAVSVTF